MGRLPKNVKRSVGRIQSLLGVFKRLKIQSKRSKRSAPPTNDPPAESSHNVLATETAPIEIHRIIWTESLLYLPNELLERILFHLHPLEVVKCRQVGGDGL
jgi:hypothetical protein